MTKIFALIIALACSCREVKERSKAPTVSQGPEDELHTFSHTPLIWDKAITSFSIERESNSHANGVNYPSQYFELSKEKFNEEVISFLKEIREADKSLVQCGGCSDGPTYSIDIIYEDGETKAYNGTGNRSEDLNTLYIDYSHIQQLIEMVEKILEPAED